MPSIPPVGLHAPAHVDELVEDLDGPFLATTHGRTEPNEQGPISHHDSFLSLTIRTCQNGPRDASCPSRAGRRSHLVPSAAPQTLGCMRSGTLDDGCERDDRVCRLDG
jgi:hypothetical protein